MLKRVVWIAAVLFLCGCSTEKNISDEQKYAAVTHYANLAFVIYRDSRITAEALVQRVETLLNSPSDHSLAQARRAWLAAREPYLQTEVFRAGNPAFDYHPRLNGWPSGAAQVEATLQRNSEFTVASLPQLVPAGGSANVPLTGFHVIEALLWGEGDRPASDFMANHHCTSLGSPAPQQLCERRRHYLVAAARRLVEDLQVLENAWSAEEKRNYRAEFLRKQLPEAYQIIFAGMGNVLLGQLAGQQLSAPLNTGTLLSSEDNGSQTYHLTLYFTAKGAQNLFRGSYQALDGSRYRGDNISHLLQQLEPDLQRSLRAAFKTTESSLEAIRRAVEQEGISFHSMVAPETAARQPNLTANQRVRDARDALLLQTRYVEKAAALFGVTGFKADSGGYNL